MEPPPRRRSARTALPQSAPATAAASSPQGDDVKRTRPVSLDPPPSQQQGQALAQLALAPPATPATPPATTATTTTANATHPPPPPPPVLFDLLFFAGVLDAVSLTSLDCCSRDLRRATTSFWGGVRADNAVTRLQSVVAVAAVRPAPPAEAYGPISKAGPCVAYLDAATRFLHPVHGQPLCTRCGRAAETADCWSPLYQHRMMDEEEAKRLYCLDAASGGAALAELLPFAVRRSMTTVTCASDGGRDVRTVSFTEYAPHYADDAKEALFSFRRPVGGGGAWGGGGLGIGEAGDEESEGGETRRVFLRRDVAALILERYGGPRLLQERIRHLDMPPLKLARPDE